MDLSDERQTHSIQFHPLLHHHLAHWNDHDWRVSPMFGEKYHIKRAVFHSIPLRFVYPMEIPMKIRFSQIFPAPPTGFDQLRTSRCLIDDLRLGVAPIKGGAVQLLPEVGRVGCAGYAQFLWDLPR